MSGTRRYNADDITRALQRHDGSVPKAAAEIGCAHSTVRVLAREAGIKYGNKRALTETKAPPEPAVTLPVFAKDDISEREIIDHMKLRYEKRQAYHKSKNWFPIKVNIAGPIGLTFWGDPHIDDDGCNWTLLDHHCDLHRASKALFSVNIGDTTNNWIGRLMRLHALQETSNKTAAKLAGWFLNDAGIRWLAVLLGNHGEWGDFGSWFRAKNVRNVPMEDWQARFRLVFPNRREVRVWASHDFPGDSMWNSLHGPQKAAHTKAHAHIYACGHKHNWATHQEESASRDFTYWLIRSRGYKFIDHFAERLGHFPQNEGASITCIINPDSKSEAGLIQAFADMDAAVDYLEWLRRSL